MKILRLEVDVKLVAMQGKEMTAFSEGTVIAI